jgi:hypothetical protein
MLPVIMLGLRLSLLLSIMFLAACSDNDEPGTDTEPDDVCSNENVVDDIDDATGAAAAPAAGY